MKSAVLIFVVGLAVFVECGKHNRKHPNKNEDVPANGDGDGDGVVTEWPTPNAVIGFQIPDIFVGDAGSHSQDTSSGKYGTKLSSKKRSH